MLILVRNAVKAGYFSEIMAAEAMVAVIVDRTAI